MLDELKEVMENYNKAAAKLMDWKEKYKNDPFFETENGCAVSTHITQVALASTLLNLKTVIILLEDIALEQKIEAESDDAD